MLQNAIRGHDLRSSRQLLKEHKQLEEEAQELAEKINSIVTRAKHLATNHFDSQRILRETDTYLKLSVLIFSSKMFFIVKTCNERLVLMKQQLIK